MNSVRRRAFARTTAPTIGKIANPCAPSWSMKRTGRGASCLKFCRDDRAREGTHALCASTFDYWAIRGRRLPDVRQSIRLLRSGRGVRRYGTSGGVRDAAIERRPGNHPRTANKAPVTGTSGTAGPTVRSTSGQPDSVQHASSTDATPVPVQRSELGYGCSTVGTGLRALAADSAPSTASIKSPAIRQSGCALDDDNSIHDHCFRRFRAGLNVLIVLDAYASADPAVLFDDCPFDQRARADS